MNLTTLSASRMIKYLHCGRAYYYSYVEELPYLPSGRMVLGSAFHEAMRLNYYQKATSRRDLKTTDLVDYFANDMESREAEYGDEDPGKLLDSGVELLGKYQEVMAPKIQPVEVEEAFVMRFKGKPWDFQGKVDLVDDKNVVIETKTTARGVYKAKYDHLIQLSGYASAYGRRKGNGVVTGRIDYAIRTKTPQVKSFDVEIGETQEKYFLSLLDQVSRGIKAGIFVPNRINNFCSRKYCSFWMQCERDCHGKVRE